MVLDNRWICGALLAVLMLLPGPGGNAQAQDTAISPHCQGIVDSIERDRKAHRWSQLLADGHALDRDCASGNDILKGGALYAIAFAELASAHFEDALATARQCETITGSGTYGLDCRLVEATALDGLGRVEEAKQVLSAILAGLPARGSQKIRKLVNAELADLDPDSGKSHSRSKKSARSKSEHIVPPDAKYYGTGFIVTGEGHIITNWHVVSECSSYWTAEGQALTLLRTDKTRDLALLKSTRAVESVAGLRAEGPKVGEPIVVYGFPLPGLLASSGIVTTGIVSADAGLGNTDKRFQISAPVQPGNSGGPVLDQEGRVIGVIQSRLSDSIVKVTGSLPQNVNFAIQEFELLGFLKEAGLAPALRGEGPKAEVSDIASGARGFVTQIICSPHA